MGKEFRASVRIDKIRDRQHLQAMTRHSLRQDDASLRRQRPGATLGKALHFSTMLKDGAKSSDFNAMRDVAAAYDGHRVRNDIAETSQGGMGFHAMVSISPEWFTVEGGHLHDTGNPRNQQMFVRAVAWLQSWCGLGSVYAARLDLDETGGGTVDAFVMPVRVDRRTGKRTISTSKPLHEMRSKHGERMSYVALQTDWADYARQHLDPAIMRGTPRAETLIDHLGVEEYKAAHVEAKRRANEVYQQAQTSLRKVRRLIDTARHVGLDVAARRRLAQLEAQADDLAEFIQDRHFGS